MVNKVDIIIPVYNAPEYTRRCIASLYEHVSKYIHKLIIYDDASDNETAKMLDDLDYPNIEIYHAKQNRGFGGTINKAVEYTSTEFILILNSDVFAKDDFLTPLLNAFKDNGKLAAVNPVPKRTHKYDNCESKNGCVTTFTLSGYAFLIKRNIFVEVGMFDLVFGRGYFEDTALARELAQSGCETGVCPESILEHALSQSFTSSERQELYKKNSVVFRKKYPDASRAVLLLNRNMSISTVPEVMLNQIDRITSMGGKVYYSGKNDELLPNYGVKYVNNSFFSLLLFVNRKLVRGYKRPNSKITDVVIGENDKSLIAVIIGFLAKKCNLPLCTGFIKK